MSFKVESPDQSGWSQVIHTIEKYIVPSPFLLNPNHWWRDKGQLSRVTACISSTGRNLGTHCSWRTLWFWLSGSWGVEPVTCISNKYVPPVDHTWSCFRNPVMYTGNDGLQFQSLMVFAQDSRLRHESWMVEPQANTIRFLCFVCQVYFGQSGPEDSEPTWSQLRKIKEGVGCGGKSRGLGGGWQTWVPTIVPALSGRVCSRLWSLFLCHLQTEDDSFSISWHAGLFQN